MLCKNESTLKNSLVFLYPSSMLKIVLSEIAMFDNLNIPVSTLGNAYTSRELFWNIQLCGRFYFRAGFVNTTENSISELTMGKRKCQ